MHERANESTISLVTTVPPDVDPPDVTGRPELVGLGVPGCAPVPVAPWEGLALPPAIPFPISVLFPVPNGALLLPPPAATPPPPAPPTAGSPGPLGATTLALPTLAASDSTFATAA